MVTCYDKSSQYGGLWCYRPDTQDSQAPFEPSVMRTTILNTSKELSAFSDFPPPAELPNFMKHNLYMDYIRSYVEHFNIVPHINLKHQVLKCEPEWKADGRQIEWTVRVRRLEGGEEFVRHFDRLMVAVGHHNIPFEPTYTGQHRFKGEIVHSASLKDIITSQRFVDKRVVVVGFGNSACDAANDISMVSSKCYLSCHRGQWFTSRYLASGPYDFYIKSRAYNVTSKLVPKRMLDGAIIKRLEQRTNHHMLGLKPKHAPSEQVPAINDLFPYKVYTGGVVLKGNIVSFSEKGVTFEGEEGREYEVDIVVLATGYVARVPFLDEWALGLRRSDGDNVAGEYDLFLNVFAPKFTLPSAHQCVAQEDNKQPPLADMKTKPQSEAIKSFAFIGLVQPNGSLTVISELQSRYVALVFAGKLELPSQRVMLAHMDKMKRMRSRAVRSHSRDQLIGSYVDYTDTIAALMGVRPNLKRIFFKDFPLWKQLMFGPSVSYQYRLSGPGEWREARETIMKVNERIYCGINEGKNDLLYKSRRKCLNEEGKKRKQK